MLHLAYRSALLAGLAVVPSLMAQAPAQFQTSMKVGGLNASGSQNRQRSGAGMMVSAELAMVSSDHEWFTSIGWREFRAQQWDATQYGNGYYRASDGSIKIGQVTPYYRNPTTGAISFSGTYDSMDWRRNALGGLVMEAGYRRQLAPESNFWWNAGLDLAFLRSRQEVSAILNVVDNRSLGATSGPTRLGGENVYSYFRGSSISPGAFVGLQYRFGRSAFAELTVRSMGYADVNWMPLTYTGKDTHTEKVSARKTMAEFSWGIRF